MTPSTPLDVVDVLGQLVDKSLVVVDAATTARVRYRLLESIRQYAQERLEAGGRHRPRSGAATPTTTWSVAETAGPHLRIADQLEWAEALRDTDNFRAVLDWAIETPSVEHALRLIAPFTVQGLPIAYLAMDWAQTAISVPGGEADPRFVGVAAWAAWGATMASDLDRAADCIAVAERAHGGRGHAGSVVAPIPGGGCLLQRQRRPVDRGRPRLGDGGQGVRGPRRNR